jgi:Flp pilus assembly protein protease CpaA
MHEGNRQKHRISKIQLIEMFEWFLLIVALVGSFIAGIIDLKTTEIPDEIPHLMAGVGIVLHLIESIAISSYTPILYSCLAGFGFLAFGFFMYYTGQWGGGDAKMLSALGFLLPTLPNAKTFFPFSLSLFFNVFFIGAIYMFVYAFAISLKEKKVWTEFSHELKANARMLVLLNVAIAFALILFGVFAMRFLVGLSFFELLMMEFKLVAFVALLFFVWRFSKVVEEVVFKKKIPVSKLREGDVLLESKLWEGVTKEQVKMIKKSGVKHVWIKEGVRFGLVFPLALLFTLFIGDGIVLLMSLV